jgi:hypothetical protein
MTVSEMQTMRANVLAALNGTLSSGVIAYGINGRNLQRMNPKELLEMLNLLDAQINRATSGNAFASQFRRPE